MSLEQIEVDGETYQLESYTSRASDGEQMTRFRVIDKHGETHDVGVRFSNTLLEHKEIYDEIVNTIEEEIKLEISRKNDGEYWNKAVVL